MKTNSIEKSFTIGKILKIDFQNFHISWKGSKCISWTFLGSLQNETIVKYVFHEMPWKTHFTVYPRINIVIAFSTKTYIHSPMNAFKVQYKNTEPNFKLLLVFTFF